jgi:hypothetical protein
MILAIEDPLSEAVALKLIADVRSDLLITTVMGRRGNSYLRGKARALNQTARTVPVMLLTDLDDPSECAPHLRSSWLGAAPHPQLLFRVAVMEIESWVLADRDAIATHLGVPAHRIPANTDTIADPKQFLVNLARRSRSAETRAALVPTPGSTARVGASYNPRLIAFVADTWSHRRAAKASPSLAKAIHRLSEAF